MQLVYDYGSTPVGANRVRPYHIYTYRKTETAPVSAGVFLVRELAVCELIAVCFIIF